MGRRVAQVIGRVRGPNEPSNPGCWADWDRRPLRAAHSGLPPALTESSQSDLIRDPTLWPCVRHSNGAVVPGVAGPVFDALTVEGFTHPKVRGCARPSTRRAVPRYFSGGAVAGYGAPADDINRDPANSELGWRRWGRRRQLPRYIAGVLARLQEVGWGGRSPRKSTNPQRMSPIEQDELMRVRRPVAMEALVGSLLEQASGDDLTA